MHLVKAIAQTRSKYYGAALAALVPVLVACTIVYQELQFGDTVHIGALQAELIYLSMAPAVFLLARYAKAVRSKRYIWLDLYWIPFFLLMSINVFGMILLALTD